MKKILIGLLAAAVSLAVLAGPAPWYKWRSKLNSSTEVCAQTSPGDGWERSSGPYKDARCEQPGTRD